MEREVWLLVREGEILDVYTNKEFADFLKEESDQVVQYTIKIEN